jgi:probable rRNA maturation factor
MKLFIDIIHEQANDSFKNFLTEEFAQDILQKTIDSIGLKQFPTSLELVIVTTFDDNIKKLNKEFLNKDKPTNVLSFPDEDRNYLDFSYLKGDVILGDIIFAEETILKESKEFKISIENHFTHLLVHGILHLLGFDHELEEDWKIMTSLEIKILEKLNIKKPPIYEQPQKDA